MKLLFLSICGKLNEPEETKYINLYLASLVKNVVPYFEKIKVILLTTYAMDDKQNSLLQKRIDEFGLHDIVELKTIDDMELPEKSLNCIKSIDWFNRIGIHMNILFDFSKKYNFFDADWIFHVDTDSEFLSDFNDCIKNINNLVSTNQFILLSLAGDSYPPHIYYNGIEYKFEEPLRANFYENDGTDHISYYMKVNEIKMKEDDHRLTTDKVVFCPAQMKIRNDFVGLSRQAANIVNFNWIAAHYPQNFKDNGSLQKIWEHKNFDDIEIRINYHMGGTVQEVVHNGTLPLTRIYLPGYSHAVLHHSSGWFQNHFIDRSIESLNAKFQDMKHIWENDYII